MIRAKLPTGNGINNQISQNFLSKMKYGKLLIMLFLLTACSSVLPSKSREISEFIPAEKKVWQTTKNDGEEFVKNSFPEKCFWDQLEKIIDGDTIITSKKGKIRLIGINTPEIKSPYTEEQPGGAEASQKIREILGKIEKVCLLTDPIGDQIDKYDRFLAYVFLADGTDLNAEMLKSGWARWYSRFPYLRKAEFKVYQAQAQQNKVGLWK